MDKLDIAIVIVAIILILTPIVGIILIEYAIWALMGFDPNIIIGILGIDIIVCWSVIISFILSTES